MSLGQAVVFADHVEARQMGEHTRELRFPETLSVQSVKVIGRSEKVPVQSSAGSSNFEGRTYPDIRMIGLAVYATDLLSPNSTMSAFKASSPGVFNMPNSQLLTNSIVVRGKFIKLSIVVYGEVLPTADSQSLPALPSIAQYLRPDSSFEGDKLDMAGLEDMRSSALKSIDAELDAEGENGKLSDATAPPSFGRALGLGGLGAVREADARLADHVSWLPAVFQESDAMEGDQIVSRLEALSHDIVLLAQRAPENAAHIHHGPALCRSLLSLVSRCMERWELRPLRATLQALATCLVSATAAAEILGRKGDLDVLVQILKDGEWSQQNLRLAALQVLLQLCSHAAGMEAFLGWSDTVSGQTTAYEVVLSLVLDGTSGQPRLQHVAATLLRRAAFYEALTRLDESCSKLEAVDGNETPQDRLHKAAAAALRDITVHLEDLSQPTNVQDAEPGSSWPFDDIPGSQLVDDSASKLPVVIFGGCGTGILASDPFAQGQCHLHGFLESFMTGRRLLPGLSVLLRRLARVHPHDRLLLFRPIQRLICMLLSCSGGPQFLAADNATYTTLLNLLECGVAHKKLPAVPRFPAALVKDLAAPHLGTLAATHVRALRLSLLLVAATRSKGRGGLLPEEHACPGLAALHRLCARGSAGRCAVVQAFRSVFFAEWLLRQIEGRLDEATPSGSRASQVQPSLRHLVAILHVLVLSDPSGAAAERFGARVLALVLRAVRVLEPEADESADPSALLEFALDSEGAEGGLGKAVRFGRRSADFEFLKNLKELAAQLRPWRQEESDANAQTSVTSAKLMASLVLNKGPRSLKRSTNEERGSRRLALVLGGHSAASGVDVPEVDFNAGEEHADLDDHLERYPSEDLTELPLLAMRVLCRRAASPKEALAIVEADGGRDGLAQLVPWLIRCAGAFSLNLEASILREEKKAIALIYATRRSHAQLLEAALQTCAHLLCGLRDAGLSHYRHNELCQTLLLLSQRLTSGLFGLAPRGFNSDPEFRLLWRHCIVWVCRVFRLWFQSFPDAAGGQLLLPLLRHARVLPTNFAGGMLLLATCGNLKPVLPTTSHQFSLLFSSSQPGDSLQSQLVLMPTGTRTGNAGMVTLRPVSPSQIAGREACGQFWSRTSEVQDWEDASRSSADPLVRALAADREAAAAHALGLVEMVNQRRERLSLDDVAELLAMAAECALTSDAFLHLCTARVLEKLTVAGLPVLVLIRRLAEAALNGVVLESEGSDDISGGAARDPRDARAVSRLLLLLAHFGSLGPAARMALTEHQIETLCQSVLAHAPATSLPPMAFSQSIRLLALMFASPSFHSVPKCRMVAKAVNLLINKGPDEGSPAGVSTICAALELLLGLCTPQWLCLSLIFSVGDECNGEVRVSVSSAFKLGHCAQRIAMELQVCCQHCRSAERGSEEEVAALEELASWLRAADSIISLSRVVVGHCPSATVFLQVVAGASSPQSLLEDLLLALQHAPNSPDIHEQVGSSMKAVQHLREEASAKSLDPLPSVLPARLFEQPARAGRSSNSAQETTAEASLNGTSNATRKDYPDENAHAMADVVALLDAAADLDASAEWASVVELDSAEPPGDDAKMDWEFDAAALKRKRQDFLEKFESDRKAQRLKQQQEKQLQEKQWLERAEERSSAPGATGRSDPDPSDAAREETRVAEASAPEGRQAEDQAVNPAEALQSFLKDHPEFMRVLQNPKKCLADPRVKTMFVTELQNYPAVKSFLAARGLQLS